MVIDIRRLRHLLALAEHGSFSRAALALHLTQPALTRSIQALEADVGAPLFHRSRSGVEPTETGQLLLRHAQALDASVRDIDRELRLSRGLELGELRIGVGPYGAAALVGPVVGAMSRLHPKLRVRLMIGPWQELPERARARDVDIVVAERSAIDALEDFESVVLSAHAACVVCRADHPLTRGGAPGAHGLFSYPLAGPRLPPGVAQALAAAAPAALRATLPRDGPLAIECDSSSVLKSILLHSDALSMMPRFMAQAEVASGLLAVIPAPALGLQLTLGAAWLRRRSMSGAGRKFIELLQEHDAALAAGDAGERDRSRRTKAEH